MKTLNIRVWNNATSEFDRTETLRIENWPKGGRTMTKTTADRLTWFLRKYDRFTADGLSRKNLRRGIRLLAYKDAVLRRHQSAA
ncbi:hypothetical protein [Paenibacillus sp. YN15]|uniref:hypothetical protein n=1 Tax=Paenibacillus sp. YN15 TaxID=1742774 RepID=UPI000DCDA946|nr:hypothetical protein [Paenibacillus sp. YN15]RAV03049.1 hypothetical protein DQG13_08305 [Paenibacillus sp. YN15]